MSKLIWSGIIGVLAAMLSLSASAATSYFVDARTNASSGGVGLSTLFFNVGDSFQVLTDPTDLWSAGPLPRWSNAAGLRGPDRFATGSDDSGLPAGTLIGTSFAPHMDHGISAAFGSLVGEIGGVFFLVGTQFSGVAPATGILNLYFWDNSNIQDNVGTMFAVVAIPEPESYALMVAGLCFCALAAKRRRHIGK